MREVNYEIRKDSNPNANKEIVQIYSLMFLMFTIVSDTNALYLDLTASAFWRQLPEAFGCNRSSFILLRCTVSVKLRKLKMSHLNVNY